MHDSTNILDFPSSSTFKWLMQKCYHLRSIHHLECSIAKQEKLILAIFR